MGLLDFFKSLFSPVPVDYKGARTGYHVVPDGTEFTYSSVAGDYRLYPLAGGFLATWRDFIQARDINCKPLWREDNTGRVAAVSADKKQVITFSNTSRFLVRLDAATGENLETFLLPDYQAIPSQMLWLPDGRLLVLMHDGLGILGKEDRQEWQAYYDFSGEGFLNGMAWWPERPSEVLIADSNGSRAMRVSLSSGKVLQEAPFQSPSIYPGPTGRQALLELHAEYVLIDPENLSTKKTYAKEGLEGVKTTEQHNSDSYSYTAWEPRALFSPDGKHLLAIDRSGLLWLYDAASKSELRIFRRELVPYAYDILWLDELTFVALCNRGHVVKVNINELEGLFDVVDFTPEDDELRLQKRW